MRSCRRCPRTRASSRGRATGRRTRRAAISSSTRPPSVTGCSSQPQRGPDRRRPRLRRRRDRARGGSARRRLHGGRRPRGARPAGRRELQALDRARTAARHDARRDQALAQIASPAPVARSSACDHGDRDRPVAAGRGRLQADGDPGRGGASIAVDGRRRLRSGRDCRGSARTGAGGPPSARRSLRGRVRRARRDLRACRRWVPAARPRCRSCPRAGTVSRPLTECADMPAADRAVEQQRNRDMHPRRRARSARERHRAFREGTAEDAARRSSFSSRRAAPDRRRRCTRRR